MWTCPHCDEPVALLEPFVPTNGGSLIWHQECMTRSVLGSVGHQLGLCTCHGGPGLLDDPPGLSRRDAARLAQALHTQTMTRTQSDQLDRALTPLGLAWKIPKKPPSPPERDLGYPQRG